MKLTIQNLEKAQKLAAQRVHLQAEHAKVTGGGIVRFANAKVVLQPFTTCKTPDVIVEIEENKEGVIAQAILDFITSNITQRIRLLDEQLAELGIEVAA